MAHHMHGAPSGGPPPGGGAPPTPTPPSGQLFNSGSSYTSVSPSNGYYDQYGQPVQGSAAPTYAPPPPPGAPVYTAAPPGGAPHVYPQPPPQGYAYQGYGPTPPHQQQPPTYAPYVYGPPQPQAPQPGYGYPQQPAPGYSSEYGHQPQYTPQPTQYFQPGQQQPYQGYSQQGYPQSQGHPQYTQQQSQQSHGPMYMQPPPHGQSSDVLARAAFARADTEGKGFLDVRGFKDALQSLGMHVEYKKVLEYFGRADRDQSGHIGQSEFIELYQNELSHMQ